jgi:hypothetical protein
VPCIHVLTPIAQTSFEITGISRNIGEHMLLFQHKIASAELLPCPISTLLEVFQTSHTGKKRVDKKRKLVPVSSIFI